MTPIAQAVIVGCVVVLTIAMVAALLALRKTALRAEGVLHVLERELPSMVTQVESLSEELRKLSHHANEELQRLGVVVEKVEEVTAKLAWLIGMIGGLTRVGQYAGIAAGVKKGVDVFVRRLRDKR